MLGQRSFLRVAQEENINVAIPMIAINFAYFMISDLIHKINDFKAISFALSEIISGNLHLGQPNINEIQKKFGDFSSLALEQYKIQGKAKQKLPHFAEKGCLFFQRALEQSSSQRVAEWKSAFFKSEKILSITGGLGVDEWAWSISGASVIACDIQADLNALVRYNQKRLGISYERVDCDAQQLLTQYADWNPDWVYVDPDRRDGQQRLGAYWEKYEPKISELLDQHANKFPKWLIKLSPMTDFRVLREVLPGKLSFMSIFWQNEVKELLVSVEVNEEASTTFLSVILNATGVQYFNEQELESYVSKISPEKTDINFTYVFEPHGGINLLSLNKLLNQFPHLKAQTPQFTLFLAAFPMPSHWGRSKRILNATQGSLKSIQKWLQKLGIEGASVTVRDAKGLSSEECKRKLGLTEDHEKVLFLTYQNQEFHAWLCVQDPLLVRPT
jgi:hypothetical protein